MERVFLAVVEVEAVGQAADLEEVVLDTLVKTDGHVRSDLSI